MLLNVCVNDLWALKGESNRTINPYENKQIQITKTFTEGSFLFDLRQTFERKCEQ